MSSSGSSAAADQDQLNTVKGIAILVEVLCGMTALIPVFLKGLKRVPPGLYKMVDALAGGVFLSVSLAHMGHDAASTLYQFFDFPVGLVMLGCGFLTIFLIEHVAFPLVLARVRKHVGQQQIDALQLDAVLADDGSSVSSGTHGAGIGDSDGEERKKGTGQEGDSDDKGRKDSDDEGRKKGTGKQGDAPNAPPVSDAPDAPDAAPVADAPDAPEAPPVAFSESPAPRLSAKHRGSTSSTAALTHSTTSPAPDDNAVTIENGAGATGAPPVPVALSTATLYAATVLTVIMTHEFFEGLALGIQSQFDTVVLSLCAVALHKAIEAFAVGAAVSESNLPRRLQIGLLLVYGCTAAVGVAVGFAISAGEQGSTSLDMATAIIAGFSAGTFLYIANMMLREAYEQKRHLGYKALLTVGGFGVMSLLAAWA